METQESRLTAGRRAPVTVGLIVPLALAWFAAFGASANDISAPLNPSDQAKVSREPRVTVSGDRGPRASGPGVRWTRDSYVSIQVNVDSEGNNIVGDAANEPSIAVDPGNPSRMVIGWRQFDSVASDFRAAGWAFSHDAGQSWNFPGVLEPGVRRSDPVLAADPDGNFYYYSLRPMAGKYSCQLFKSSDGGVSWNQTGGTDYGGDKAWMAIDRTGGIGSGRIYCAWGNNGCCEQNTFTRSSDGGQTFDTPIPIPGGPIFGVTTVGPEGEIYVVGQDLLINSRFHFTRALIREDPQAPVEFDFSVEIDLGGWLIRRVAGSPNPEGLLGQVWVATDHSKGSSRGNIYVLCSVLPSDPDSVDLLDVHFVRSTNGGLTWSDPVRVNDDPTTNAAWQWFGTISVAPNGRIDVIWNDTRNDPFAVYSELYYSSSSNAGRSWSQNVPVSPPFNHYLGYPEQRKLGDYYDMVSDNAGASIVYAATFNGEQDVYFLRIVAPDCNDNGIADSDDIASGVSDDCNQTGIPDECELDGGDCNSNGVLDSCEIVTGSSHDCQPNGLPDVCDIESGTSRDCNASSVPDECELTGNDCDASGVPDECELTLFDCNSNGIIDACDIATGTSTDCQPDGLPDECGITGNDCNANGRPDECEVAESDCNANAIVDECDVAEGRSSDCQANNVPDECELEGNDCNANDVPDECELAVNDCNGNGVLDTCDIAAETSPDCQANGVPDECEVKGFDCDGNGIPDECELAGQDCNANGTLDACDIAEAVSFDCQQNGTPDECELVDNDCNSDGVPDECSLEAQDCNDNRVPDDCELTANDCNVTGVPDECEIADASSQDCQGNSVPDECELLGNDCDSNGVPDECVSVGNDCNANGVPDSCELSGNDCNTNGVIDVCDISQAISRDCQPNGIPDECELLASDCNSNAVPDECELVDNDCNANGTPDTCELAGNDCNANGVIDVCDISDATSRDCQTNGVPDECELLGNDCNGNDIPDDCDIANDSSTDENRNGMLDECEPPRCEVDSTQTLTADARVDREYFGYSVAVSENTAVVGAYGNEVNGRWSGAAYVRTFDGAQWAPGERLVPSNGAADDRFGWAVGVSSDVAVIGAYGNDDRGDGAGAAYVFRLDGTTWTEEVKLYASDSTRGNSFGNSVAISGDTIVIGARHESQNGDDSGSAYIYRWTGSNWSETQKLVASDGRASDHFGFSLAVARDTIVVGAYGDDDNGQTSGAAYVFRSDGSNWFEEQKLLASDGEAGDRFGHSVSVSGETIVIGARSADANGQNSGAAYVFHFNGKRWNEGQKLLASDGEAGDYFGQSVAVSANVILIGTPRHVFDDSGSGAVYLFVCDASYCAEQATLVARNNSLGDEFGAAVSLSASSAVVGAYNAREDSTGRPGMAYMFHGMSDCNANSGVDTCDIAFGTSNDEDLDGIPDECDLYSFGDADRDGDVDLDDYRTFVGCAVGPSAVPDTTGRGAPDCLSVFDLDEDADVDLRDFSQVGWEPAGINPGP